jgi:hypothetical protein
VLLPTSTELDTPRLSPDDAGGKTAKEGEEEASLGQGIGRSPLEEEEEDDMTLFS